MANDPGAVYIHLRGLRKLLTQRAAADGISASELVRRAVAAAIQAEAKPDGRVTADRSDGGALRAVTVRLTDVEAGDLRRRAAAAGISQTEYVARLVRGAGKQSGGGLEAMDLVAVERAVAALRQSNSALAAMGRNLNQVARTLNAEREQTSKADRDTLAAVSQAVRAHLEVASVAVAELHAVRRARPSRARS